MPTRLPPACLGGPCWSKNTLGCTLVSYIGGAWPRPLTEKRGLPMPTSPYANISLCRHLPEGPLAGLISPLVGTVVITAIDGGGHRGPFWGCETLAWVGPSPQSSHLQSGCRWQGRHQAAPKGAAAHSGLLSQASPTSATTHGAARRPFLAPVLGDKRPSARAACSSTSHTPASKPEMRLLSQGRPSLLFWGLLSTILAKTKWQPPLK